MYIAFVSLQVSADRSTGVSLALGYEDMPLQASIGLRALALGRLNHLSTFLYRLMIAIVLPLWRDLRILTNEFGESICFLYHLLRAYPLQYDVGIT